jgi:hypothetical protein
MPQRAKSYPESYTLDAAMLILRATRSWIRALQPGASKSTRDCYVAIWNESFQELGSMEAKTIWGNFMQHFCQNISRPFTLGCRGCGKVSEDEYLLLTCIAAQQQNKPYHAVHSLKQWFDAPALEKADAITEAFADQLSICGYHLPRSAGDMPLYDLKSTDMVDKTAMH